jgi:hypothetical protein
VPDERQLAIPPKELPSYPAAAGDTLLRCGIPYAFTIGSVLRVLG